MARHIASDIVIAGGGLAGIVTAPEALRGRQNRDHCRLGHSGAPWRACTLGLWRHGADRLPATAHENCRFPGAGPARLDKLRGAGPDRTSGPAQWARYYVENSRTEVHDWLIDEGLKFMPAVNWVERGRFGDGNSVPRYHIVWGTSWN